MIPASTQTRIATLNDQILALSSEAESIRAELAQAFIREEITKTELLMLVRQLVVIRELPRIVG